MQIPQRMVGNSQALYQNYNYRIFHKREQKNEQQMQLTYQRYKRGKTKTSPRVLKKSNKTK